FNRSLRARSWKLVVIDAPSQVNPFSVENQLTYHYYEANVALGNQLLDDAGFADVDSDGYREAPNGEDFDVLIEVAASSEVAIETGAIFADALQALNVDATSEPTDFYEYLDRLYFHGDYDMAFVGSSFSDFDVDWLAYEYWSEYADEPYWNFPNFANATYDGWRDQLLHATQYEDVYEAAIEMQKILVYQSPMIIAYENFEISAYRTDRFEGFKNDVSGGVPGYWTNYKVHLKDSEGGPFGGTFTWSNPLDVDTFNFMTSSSTYTMNVLDMLYDRLIKRDWTGDNINWLITDYMAKTNADDPNVPAGHTRFTFNMVQNASWTDGEPLTAEDVAFSLNYYHDSPGNPYGADLSEMTAAYAKTPYTLEVEFNTESYWHLHTIGYKPIIPKHIFVDIGLDGWNTWDPNPPAEEMVTSGPFYVSQHVAGEFVELSRNPSHFHSLKPDIDSPQDIEYERFATGNSITWDPSGIAPGSYEILRNGTLVKSGAWNESSEIISISVDGLDVETYNYTLIVYDANGNSATDSVMVTVCPPTSMTLDHPWDIVYEQGTAGNSITWNVYAGDPTSYELFRNGTLIASDTWDGSNITVDVDGLDSGVHNFTIVVSESGGNSINDTVFVIVAPFSPPTIDEPDDIEYEVGSTGHAITWSPWDLSPDTYEIYMNGTLVESDTWDGGDIVLSVDGLDVGTYNYTIIVCDTIGNTTSDTVIVTVVEPVVTTTTTTTTTGTTNQTTPLGELPFGVLILGLAGVAVALVLSVIFVKWNRG
ncbi:MAG: ABC transporter substrate-binding protein, partial [Promethearchaeia archaeon]